MGVRLGASEPVQSAAIVKMALEEGWRHPLGTNDLRARGSKVERDRWNANWHQLDMPSLLPAG